MGQTRCQVELTVAAWADLDEIDDYWTARGDAWRGEKYFYDLRDAALTELSDLQRARRGRKFPGSRHPAARQILAFGVYRIIYEIDEPACRVDILRFWHTHRDDPRGAV